MAFNIALKDVIDACTACDLELAQTRLWLLGTLTVTPAQHRAYHSAANAVQRLICDLYIEA